MPGSSQCSACGARLAAGASPEGLCPACHRKTRLPIDTNDTPTQTAPEVVANAESRAHSRLRPGRTFGPYRIERLLGRGGMGEVYEAEELESGRRVALKILSHDLDDQNRARFLREGRLAASISQPNTIYVFGTSEIDGTPVIAMELARGGTLKDRVKDEGPLPPSEAVDVILQVVAGLEAAASGGVLHRDVKPSNCFVDRDGTVKVGDFGLSISTLAREETSTQLTISGSFLGTPAFASTEQLRGEKLDVRSDIYSVGATLYFLLTGRPPFEDANLVKLLTMVAQDLPPSPHTLRPGLPKGLAALALRCLAKRSDDRFATYAALAQELEPYGSRAPSRARLGLRLLAGVIDTLGLAALLSTISFAAMAFLREAGFSPSSAIEIQQYGRVMLVPSLALQVLYFAVCERSWGATLGKALCRLRVVGASQQSLGPGTALLRATVYVVGYQLLSLVWGYALTPAQQLSLGTRLPLLSLFSLFFPAVSMALLFSTARRKNGLAAVHDLLTDTRVVSRSRVQSRPSLRTARHEVEPPTTGRRVGPYDILEDPVPNRSVLAVGYDAKLLRAVWIVEAQIGSEAVSPLRRDLARPTRLRWLAGRRTASECWDAYEAPFGRPLLSLLSTPTEWQTLRHWLHDLAVEVDAGLGDGSLPELGIDRVWITPDGRARLLDWRAPGVEEASPTLEGTPTADLESAQRFLHRVGWSALQGPQRDAQGDSARPAPLPLPATTFLGGLQERTFQTSRLVVESINSLVRGPAVVSRRRRAAHLTACGSVPALLSLFVLASVLVVSPSTFQRSPDVHEFMECLARLERLDRQHVDEGLSNEAAREREALEIYVANRFAGWLSESSEVPMMQATMVAMRRPLLERAVAAHPNPSDEAVRAASGVVEALLQEGPDSAPGVIAAGRTLFLWLTVGLAALLSALLFRGGIVLRLFGIGIVTGDGTEVSRLRAFLRAFLAWSPVGLASALFFTTDVLPLPTLVFLLFVGGALWAALDPTRSLQDRIAGTYLVPR